MGDRQPAPSVIWLVRHGESMGNVADAQAQKSGAGRLELDIRDPDVPLSDTGRAQAEALGTWLAAVEAAQADGRWERAYGGPATITVPDDFAEALAAEPGAQKEFEILDGANRYAVLWRVHTANTPATRAKRIANLVQMLAEGRRIH